MTRTRSRPEMRSKLEASMTPLSKESLETLAVKGAAWATAAVAAAAAAAAAAAVSDGTATADEMEQG
eukprot:5346023-Pyramimonas_sp.AAC.1